MERFVYDEEMLTFNRTIDRLISEVRIQKENKLKEAAKQAKLKYDREQRRRDEELEQQLEYKNEFSEETKAYCLLTKSECV